MTMQEALNLKPGDIVYQRGAYNADGTPRRWRVNGKVKTWKTQPSRIRVPLKHGLYTYDYMDETSLDKLFISEEEC